MSKRVKEIIQNVLIVVLSVSAVFLGYETGIYNELVSSVSATMGGESSKFGTEEISLGAHPVYMAVTHEDGSRFGVKYDDNEADALYEKSGNIIGELLGSAGAAVKISRREFQRALTSQSLFWDYLEPVELNVLAEWLGVKLENLEGSFCVRRLCASVQNNNVKLYFRDEAGSAWYSCTTAVTPAVVTAVTSVYTENAAVFAFELGETAGGDAELLLMPGVSELRTVLCGNPLESQDVYNTVLEELGVNTHINSTYTESDGTKVYVEENFTLKISPNGEVVFHQTDTAGQSEYIGTAADAVGAASGAVVPVVSKYCGEAAICYTGCSGENGNYEVTFDYRIAGGRVVRDESAGACVKVKNGKITEIEIRFMSCELSEESVTVLPELQAAYAAGGELRLCYVEQNGSAAPVWTEK